MRNGSKNGVGPWARVGWLGALVVLVSVAAIPGTARAADDDTKTTYTRIELWQVERASWDSFVEMYEKYDQPIMEKLMADGAIIEWGIDAMALHSPEGYTHSTWYSAESLGALVKAGDAYDSAWKAMGKESSSNLEAEFAAMITKHRDYVTDTDALRAAAGTVDGGYYHGHSVLVKAGEHRGFHSYWDNRMKPIFESLFDKGVVLAYGLSTENIVTDNPRGHTWWYVVGDADGLDAVDAAFDAAWDTLDEEGRRARWASIRDVIEEGSYREELTSIIHWSTKAQ